jgi:anti-sigma regulatory factor (Ser/Thr protein kinase)
VDGDDLLAVFPAVPSSVPAARRWAHQQLTLRGIDDATARTAALLVSELATNAVVHTRSARFTVCLDQADDIEIAVLDHDTETVPRPRASGGWDTGGRGLVLVQGLSDMWGIAQAGDGKWVWSRLQLPEAP